ncbi:MAG TPA: hypothetical protein PKN33_14180 [Phycisphaerae bacterium]|nr:hypothetical protein [Phycisphaerae bacterium]
MKRAKAVLFTATLLAGTVFGILPGCLEANILRLVTPYLLS